MAINLQKGQHISLSKEAPGLTKIMCGLGWDVAKRAGGGIFGAFSKTNDCDLDASVICLDINGKVRDAGNVIYFGNLSHKSGAIVHLGDNLTGAGDGDDEQIIVDLSRLPKDITKLCFTVNIYDMITTLFFTIIFNLLMVPLSIREIIKLEKVTGMMKQYILIWQK